MKFAVPLLTFVFGLAQVESPWQDLFAKEEWYKSAEGKEQLFKGNLEAIPKGGGIGILQRTSHYKLGDRKLYTGARKHSALDNLVGKTVEIRGKAVDFELEGTAVREIWPAAIRELPLNAK
ncbi:MAG: hypothetical protein U0744_11350 [Gemmataceae bacterium]